MTLRIAIVAALALSTTLALAAPRAARNRRQPATRPVALAPAAPATQPATQQHFPTPQELFEKIKANREQRKRLKQVAYFDLAHPIQERPADFSLFRDTEGLTLRSLLDRLHEARGDKDVKAVLVTATDPGLNLAQASELRDALLEIRKAGKKAFVYADAYDTATYTLATGASDVCMLEGGEILIPGIGVEAMFAKGLLDKAGVQADYVQIGEYKGADEMFTRTAPTEELRGEMDRLTQAIYDHLVASIATQRKIDPPKVRAAIDQALIPGREAKRLGLVDHLVDVDGLRELIARRVGGEIDLLHGYGEPEEEPLDFSNPWALISRLSQKPEETTGPKVAVVYAEGEIVDGEGGDSMWGGSVVGSEDIREAFRMASRDDQVKAVVVRIDSPGGSALASEAMWQAARRLAAKKPVVVSIGSMAASGGYYLASAGDHVIADPTAVVGSIGVVGGKFVVKDLYGKLGVTTESFSKGLNADLFSSSRPFDERQRAMVTGWMRQTYEQFTDRIRTTRGRKIADIDKVARGRVFIAKQAKELGMVDELGGLGRAIEYAAGKAGLSDGQYEVRTLPPTRTLADYFSGGHGDARTPLPGVSFGLTQDSVLRALPPAVRQPILRQVRALQLLQDRPVMLMSPYQITIR